MPYALSIKIKYTVAYIAVQINNVIDCFLKSPRFRYRYTGHIAAIVDQSDGKVTTHIRMIRTIFAHCGSRSVVNMTMRTTDHASDHITLVALNILLGIKGIPPAKLYAKCDMTAKTNNLKIYFFTFLV